jgi:uncharacterized membrane protein YphA (DoxX/SURF4 family)
MERPKLSQNNDLADLTFRALFSLIFVGLGFEHLFSDQMLQLLMPTWIEYPRLVSIISGLWLLFWGSLIIVGWQLRYAAFALGTFLIIVTILVHLPGVLIAPIEVQAGCEKWWDILQRSNLAKNLCLLGVCIHFIYYQPGRYSLESFLTRSSKDL